MSPSSESKNKTSKKPAWKDVAIRAMRICLPLSRDYRSRDGVVGIVTGYGLDDRGVGVRAPVGSRIFSTSSRPVLGPTQSPIQWVAGALFPEVKRSECEANHSPLTSAEVKKM
jgi:hypothetical protein